MKYYRKKVQIMLYVFSCTFVICMSIIAYKVYMYFKPKNILYNATYKYIYERFNDIFDTSKTIIKSKSIQKLEQLQKINPDIVALLEIEGTNINYPVVHGQDNSYYLRHNYKKEVSKDGALMLDVYCDLVKPTVNFLIYGHNNIGSRGMFVDLIKYKSKLFYETHKIIKFTTNNEEADYEIISVFMSQVYYSNQTDVFKYYFFRDAKTREVFDNYIANCKKLSIYEIDSSAEYGDQLMTLSTCEYSNKNGRFVVVTKKIK